MLYSGSLGASGAGGWEPDEKGHTIVSKRLTCPSRVLAGSSSKFHAVGDWFCPPFPATVAR